MRTLLIAKRKISQKEYEKWRTQYEEAQMIMSNRDEAKSMLMDEIEKNLEIIGSTAIEDCL